MTRRSHISRSGVTNGTESAARHTMTVDEQIVRTLHKAREPLGPKEIAQRTGEDHGYVRKRVRELDKKGEIQGLSGGKYQVREERASTAAVEILSEGVSPRTMGMISGTEANGDRQGVGGETEPVRTSSAHDVIEVDGRFLEGLAGGHEKMVSEMREGGIRMRNELDAGAKDWVVARVEGHSGDPVIPSGTWVLGIRREEVKEEGYHLLYRDQGLDANAKRNRRKYEAGYLFPWSEQKSRGFIEETGTGRENRAWVQMKGGRYRLKASPRVGTETVIIGAIVGALTNPNALERVGRPKE